MPFLRIIIPIIIGILLYSLTNYHYPDFLILYICLFLIILHILQALIKIPNKTYSQIFGLVTYLYLIAFGAVLIREQTNPELILPESSEEQYFIGYFIDYPVKKPNSIQAIIKIEKRQKGNQIINYNLKILSYFIGTNNYSQIEPGSRIVFQSNLIEIENDGNPGEFNVKRYYQSKNIHFIAFLKNTDWQIVNTKPKKNIITITKKARNNILSIYKKYGISGSALSVLSALSIGQKKDIEPDIRQNYSSSGAMHILAVSGLHVGIIFLLFSFFLKFLNKLHGGKIIRALFLIILLWLYAFTTGLSPSVSRATIMFTFHIIGSTTKRKGSIYNTIALTAFLLLIINPSIIFSPGFQLSFIAVIGIIYFYPIIYRVIKVKNSVLNNIWKISCLSLAAQLATFPISIFYFNTFPNYFILTNLLAIPLATIIIYLSIILIIFSIIPSVSTGISFILKSLVSALNTTTEFIANIPFSTSNNIYFPIEKVFLIYIIIILMVVFFNSRKGKNLIWILLFIVCFQINEIMSLYINSSSKKIIIWNTNEKNIHIISGRKSLLFSDISKMEYKENLKFIISKFNRINSLNQPAIADIGLINDTIIQENNKDLYIRNSFGYFSNKKFLIINSNNYSEYNNIGHFRLDYIFLLNNYPVDPKGLLIKFMPTKIIIGAGVSAKLEKKWQIAAIDLNIPTFSVKKEGAFILELN
ncbi:ComEC/Rec2 family competence protein [Bacteroidota bacterium]